MKVWIIMATRWLILLHTCLVLSRYTIIEYVISILSAMSRFSRTFMLYNLLVYFAFIIHIVLYIMLNQDILGLYLASSCFTTIRHTFSHFIYCCIFVNKCQSNIKTLSRDSIM
uniref:Uncharacterized protein n=1 Tax=Cacopsylla melanoneura TaxID=428564 RepID=A0A8D8TH15_9HEMI